MRHLFLHLVCAVVIPQALFRQTRTHSVNIQPQLAIAHPLTLRKLIAHAGFRFMEHITDPGVRQHHDAIVVGHYDIARLYKLTCAYHRDVNRTEALFHRPLGINLTGPDGESHFPQRLRITNADIAHQPDHAARLERRRQ
ncbi:hypothetical protein MTE2_4867 [Klebsiella pneumoniae VA360]|nr:hypothetical protein MTE2_4867 [Klebsiella pneumoniae VA360]